MKNKKIISNCCGNANSDVSRHPDHTEQIHRINRIKGQLEGIKKMIEQRCYCPEIITQTSAARAAIASLESAILEKHINACVREAFREKSKDSEVKIKELLNIFKAR